MEVGQTEPQVNEFLTSTAVEGPWASTNEVILGHRNTLDGLVLYCMSEQEREKVRDMILCVCMLMCVCVEL